jgi:PhzF family phenazine biosynthesis protein
MHQWTIDAFASEAFQGNPACVVEPFDAWPSVAWMQKLAQENNQAETAFLRRRGPGEYDLRWFTPEVEAPLCGHATLAAAHAITAELGEAEPPLAFHTLSGVLTVAAVAGGYEMDFPADPPRPVDGAERVQAAIGGVEVLEVWAAAYLVAVLRDEEAVNRVRPDLAEVLEVSRALTGGRGDLIVTAKAEGRPYDVVSRFFAPGAGIPEDPTTGSAHCILAPFWSERLGRPRLDYFQAFPGRGGRLTAERRGERVRLAGQAVTVVESRLRLAAG